MEQFCYLNGRILPLSEAKISIQDLGLIRSYAVFDYLRTHNGKPFRLKDYLARFRNSAMEFMLPFELSDTEIRGIIDQLLERSGMIEAGIKLVLTGGVGKDSMSIGEPTFAIYLEPLPMVPEAYYSEGVKLITNEYKRDAPESKSTNYLNSIKMEPVKKEHGAFDLLYVNKGDVLEVSRNNFFLFMGDVLVTPATGILPGITRKVILEIAEGNFELEERVVKTEELETASEAFVTGTSKGIIPVTTIDDFKIGDGLPGKHTKKLMELLKTYTSNYQG